MSNMVFEINKALNAITQPSKLINSKDDKYFNLLLISFELSFAQRARKVCKVIFLEGIGSNVVVVAHLVSHFCAVNIQLQQNKVFY